MTGTQYRLDAQKARLFHGAFSAYSETPLTTLTLETGSVWAKDETARMGLGAFKAVGGTYAVGQMIAQALGSDADPQTLGADAMRDRAKALTFVCASAGNHGMAVAEGARLFGAGCRIHLSETVPQDFADRLAAKGAQVVRSGAVYEDSIAAAIKDAEESGAIHLADGSWQGYIEPPRLVMEGYTVLAEEMRAEFEKTGTWPSHVYLQAGVGGFAGAIAYMIRENWAEQPQIVIVEPDAAPCLQTSVAKGEAVAVAGPVSNMGRLDCKEPSLIAFDILRHAGDRFVTITDEQADAAVAVAAEHGVQTTPSGAAGFAALLAETDPPARPLVIFSEGLTG